MSLHDAAQHLASQGRYGDSMLVHMNPKEVAGLQALAQQKGTTLTRNPHTGLPEAFGFGDLNPFRIVQGKGEIGESGFGSVLIGAALMAAGVPAMAFGPGALSGAAGAGLLTGGASALMGGGLKGALSSGLGAYGGASMYGSLSGAPSPAPTQAPVEDRFATPVGSVSAAPPTNASPGMDFGGSSSTAATATPPPTLAGQQAANQVATTTPAPTISGPLTNAQVDVGLGTPGTYTPTGEASLMDQAGKFVKDYKWPLGAAGLYALTQEKPKGVQVERQSPGKIRPYVYDPKTQGLTQLRPYDAPGYAAGGLPVEEMSNANAVGANTGYPQADITGHAYATPWQTPVSQNVVQGTADTGVNRMSGEMLAEGGVTGSGNLNLNIPLNLGGGQNDVEGYRAAGSGGGNRSSFTTPSVSGGMFSQAGAGGYGPPMDPRMMQGGFDPRAISANPQGFQQMMQMAQQRERSMPGSTFLSQAGGMGLGGLFGGQPVGRPSYEQYVAGRNPMQQDVQMTRDQYNSANTAQQVLPTRFMAGGGMAGGGLPSLGGYSDGGRLLKGPGDGVSDSIPAVIGGHQPARLADGEFVVPARIVSELGNGSTEAGARKLYTMMDRIQKTRGKTVGKNKVATNSRADKHLPA